MGQPEETTPDGIIIVMGSGMPPVAAPCGHMTCAIIGIMEFLDAMMPTPPATSEQQPLSPAEVFPIFREDVGSV
jgi:hypothetical protein